MVGLVSRAYPDHTRFNEAVGFGAKKEAHRLAHGKGGLGMPTQAIRGEVHGIGELFSRFTLNYESNSHLDPPTLRPAFDWSCVFRRAIRGRLPI